MVDFKILLTRRAALLAVAIVIFSGECALGDPIAWTSWTSATAGTPGSASGTIGSIGVTYSGQTNGLLTNYPSWTPVATWQGGVVGNAPPAANNSIKLTGGSSITETITFSTPVADPILAVWSLGQPGATASFDFTPSESFTVEGGGPSAEYGGKALTSSGSDVFGAEGNGLIQLNGVYQSISFTTPTYENYYAFTVGEDSTLTSQIGSGGTVTPTPEPSSIALLGTGLIGAAGLLARSKRHS